MESNLAMTAFVRAVERNGFSRAARDRRDAVGDFQAGDAARAQAGRRAAAADDAASSAHARRRAVLRARAADRRSHRRRRSRSDALRRTAARQAANQHGNRVRYLRAGARHSRIPDALPRDRTRVLADGPLALLGLGVIRLSDIIVGPAIRDGRLVALLADVHRPEALPLYAVYAASRRRPLKVGAMIDFLVEKCADPPWKVPAAMLVGPAKRSPAGARRKR